MVCLQFLPGNCCERKVRFLPALQESQCTTAQPCRIGTEHLWAHWSSSTATLTLGWLASPSHRTRRQTLLSGCWRHTAKPWRGSRQRRSSKMATRRRRRRWGRCSVWRRHWHLNQILKKSLASVLEAAMKVTRIIPGKHVTSNHAVLLQCRIVAHSCEGHHVRGTAVILQRGHNLTRSPN